MLSLRCTHCTDGVRAGEGFLRTVCYVCNGEGRRQLTQVELQQLITAKETVNHMEGTLREKA